MNSNDFLRVIQKLCKIDAAKPVVAGISGGPDSLCLLDLLHGSGVRTIAAHLDHSLREESLREADYVADLCARYGIPLVREKVDVAEFSRKNKFAVEEAARVMRYEFLFKTAESQEAQAVLVAHHSDDQIETVLMHLLRGSGLSGLAGMRMVLLPNPWSYDIPLVRPLLQTSRSEIIEYCRENHLEPVQDRTNLDTRYYRNRIRHELIPVLETYNPLIKDRLQKMSRVIGQEDAFMHSMAQQAFQKALIQHGDKFIVMSRETVRQLDAALIRRVLRMSINLLNKSLRDIEFDCVERGVDFIRSSNRSNQEVLSAGLSIFTCFHDRLVIGFDDDPLLDLWPQVAAESELTFPKQGDVQLNEKWVIHTKVVPQRTQVDDPFCCQVDADLLSENLVVNTFQPGDRFVPFGMGGKSKRLGDFWTNEGLPSRARKHWPLVRSGEEIIWVPGFRIADRVKVTDKTKRIQQMEMVKK